MNKLIVPAVIVAIGAASSYAWSRAASPQATESARRVPFVITGDNGGSVRKYYEKYEAWVAAGATFRIDGRCRSACTLVLAWPDRVCVTERAELGRRSAMVWAFRGHRPRWRTTAHARRGVAGRSAGWQASAASRGPGPPPSSGGDPAGGAGPPVHTPPLFSPDGHGHPRCRRRS